MLSRRLVVCLDVRDARVVKGVQFEQLRDMGDPVELSVRYEREGADEIVFLDISATPDERGTLWDIARRTAEQLFIPLTIGGGLRSLDDVTRALRSGADKAALNSAALARPELLSEVAERFGAQCVVASVDARRVGEGRWEVFGRGGRSATGRDAVEWAAECVSRGAGEILLTSIDRDGARSGYDVELTRAVASAVNVPVVASGGAGTPEHVAQVLVDGGADAALVAGMLHDGSSSIARIKKCMVERGLHVRALPHAERVA